MRPHEPPAPQAKRACMGSPLVLTLVLCCMLAASSLTIGTIIVVDRLSNYWRNYLNYWYFHSVCTVPMVQRHETGATRPTAYSMYISVCILYGESAIRYLPSYLHLEPTRTVYTYRLLYRILRTDSAVPLPVTVCGERCAVCGER